MANTNVARGFIPYAYVSGAPYNGSANIYYKAAGYGTALYVGDPVVTHSASNDANGVPAVQIAVSNTVPGMVGVVVGISDGGPLAATPVTVTRDLPIYSPASTAQYLLVADDPNLLFMIQDDASSQATAPNLWPGLNAHFVSGTGSTVTGYSGYQLLASSVATTGTLDLKIIRGLNQADNVISSVANTNMNAKWLVRVNRHEYVNQTAGL